MAPPDDLVAASAVSDQLGSGYDRYSDAERALHLELLHAVQRPGDVALDVRPDGGSRWTVTICAADCLGALSIIAGLFSAHRLDVAEADVFTLRFAVPDEGVPPVASPWRQGRPPRAAVPRAPTRKLLDVFRVAALDTHAQEVWGPFREDLTGLFALLAEGRQEAAQERVIDRFSEGLRAVPEPDVQLLPMTIEVSNDASPEYTLLSIRSEDTTGFLFAFTNALAMLKVNIQRAEIRTARGQVYDVFWLTDASGRKVTSERALQELRVAAALIKHFTHLLPRCSNPAQALRQFHAFTRDLLARPDWAATLHDLESAPVLGVLADLMGVSRFLWEDFLRMQHASLFPVLVDAPALDERRSKQHLQETFRRRLESAADEVERAAQLKWLKDHEMFRIDLRHITGRVDFQGFAEELTELAEVVVEEVAGLVHRMLEPKYGVPLLSDRRQCSWCICALGKFGGRELGFGSDIEMLFVYEGPGATTGPERVANALYFEEWVRRFLDVLKAPREGVFEIDLRLRPHGNAGPLASTPDGFQHYYAEGGAAQQFERLAMVKLRPVAGNPALGERIVLRRDAFVYSGRPLDMANILHLRQRQATELVARGTVNAKHSPGGLVDVEYFVQACQISVGHRDTRVRVTNTLEALDRLAAGGHVSEEQRDALRRSYQFLRRLIDALRVVRGHAKDLTIPVEESQEFVYLAKRLRYQSPEELSRDVAAAMSVARQVWEGGLPGQT